MKSNGNSKKALAWISSVAGILIAGAILIFVNAILKPAALRWDCTAEKRYTLSQGSENILKHLDKVVSIRFYYSRNASGMPVVLKNYATRVEDLLGEFQRAGGDKIKLSKLNPVPDSDEEDSAVLDGVSGHSLDMFGSGDPVYFGVAVSCGGKTAVLPFLSPESEAQLEYDLARAVTEVTAAKKVRLGILSSLPVMGGFNGAPMMMNNPQRTPPWWIVSELKRNYDVVEIPEEYKDSLPDKMYIPITKRTLYKSDLMMLEILAQCNWTRPIYVATTVGAENYMNLGDNFVQEGLVYRITPFDTKQSGKTVDTERMYNNLMNKFKFGGLDNPDIYFDETVWRMCLTHRRLFSQLAMELIKEGKKDKALKVMEYAEKAIPAKTLPHSMQGGSIEMAKAWNILGKPAEAEKIAVAVGNTAKEYMNWYLSLNTSRLIQSSRDCMMNLYVLDEVSGILENCKSQKATEYRAALQTYMQQCMERGVHL